jgi:glycosyltransferase involved in cell wall biosynthesis
MRILVIPNCPLEENQGSGYVILNTYKCLIKLGHNVNLIKLETVFPFPFLKSKAVIYRKIIGMASYILFKKIKNYDLFIFYGAESFLAIYILKNIFRIKKPIILHSNGLEVLISNNLNKNPELFKIKSKWYHFDLTKYFMYTYNTVNQIITVSKYEQDFAIINLHLSPKMVSYINIGLPNLFLNNLNYNYKNKIITFCGRWSTTKGNLSMIDSISFILDKYKNFKFRIIGCGNDFNLNENFNIKLHPQIEIINFIDDKNILLNYYNDTFIFLFPSLTESFGIVIAEAMASACVVISGPTGFAAELLNYEEAIVLKNPNSYNIIEALEMVIQNPDLSKKMSQLGKLKSNTLTWNNFEIKLNVIINNII